jgi:hypothetical protein
MHRNGHDHHTRTIAIASCGAGLAIGTAAGALMVRTRHRMPSAQNTVAPTETE